MTIERPTSPIDSVRRDALPLRRAFVQRAEGIDTPTPMASLLRSTNNAGAGGGALRITLLMSLIWVSSRPPFTTSRVASYWAELVGHPDPRGEGARTIRDCLADLEQRRFISLISDGQRVTIVLNNEAGARSSEDDPIRYTLPYENEAYLQVPRAFWSSGLVGDLTGAGVAMYLIALALTRHELPKFYLSGEFFDAHFGISRSTRKRGLKELQDKGVLTVESVESLDFTTMRKRRRNVYTITNEFKQPAAWEGEQPAAEVDSKPTK